MDGHEARLFDGIIQSPEKSAIVVEGVGADAVVQVGDETVAVFLAVLLQQFQPLVGFLFTGQQLTQATGGFVHAHL